VADGVQGTIENTSLSWHCGSRERIVDVVCCNQDGQEPIDPEKWEEATKSSESMTRSLPVSLSSSSRAAAASASLPSRSFQPLPGGRRIPLQRSGRSFVCCSHNK
jgi:hypothetical protein